MKVYVTNKPMEQNRDVETDSYNLWLMTKVMLQCSGGKDGFFNKCPGLIRYPCGEKTNKQTSSLDSYITKTKSIPKN